MIPATEPAILPSSSALARHRAALCPFHDGIATLDLFLAELDPRDTGLFDAVLDLRATASSDPEACVAQLFRVRRMLGDRHYLAFYRVRCWASRALRIEIRTARGEPWQACAFPLNAARMDEVVNTALAELADGGTISPLAHARFVFAPV